MLLMGLVRSMNGGRPWATGTTGAMDVRSVQAAAPARLRLLRPDGPIWQPSGIP